ncbi:MAG: hypothetical protein M1830_009994 [Pleopsidium flavum]|nr:MAG: hypothetical protein M1830_009994 [Pleopsidium flavum]
MANAISGVLLILITILLPPVGVFMIAGCGADLFINIILTCLGVFPGHIHAFYLEFIYFDRRDRSRLGTMTAKRAPLVFSQNVQNGGATTYGTVGY